MQCKLSEISTISNPDAVTNLYFKGEHLYQLPEEIYKFKNLTEIFAPDNNLKQINIDLKKFKQLKTLNLRNNKFSKIPPEITRLKNLETLSLRNNQIKRIPKALFRIKSLSKLDLYGNDITSIPNSIGEALQLNILNVGYNRIKNLPEEIKYCKNLHQLNLEHNTFTNFPDAILDLPWLFRLNLGFNKLKIIDFKKKPLKLNALLLNDNKLNQILQLPDDITRLDLSNNKFKTVPPSIAQLNPNIFHSLKLKNNNISYLPDFISTFENSLKELDLRETKIKSLTSEQYASLRKVYDLKTSFIENDYIATQSLSEIDSKDEYIAAFETIKGKTRKLKALPLDALLNLLPINNRELDLSIRKILYKKQPKVKSFSKISKLFYFGRLDLFEKEAQSLFPNSLSKITLDNRNPIGLQYCIAGRKMDILNIPNIPVESTFTYIQESDFIYALHKMEGHELAFETDPTILNNLTRLIQSDDLNNVLLGLNMIWEGGLPKSLWSVIFLRFRSVKYLSTTEASALARKILWLHATDEQKWMLRNTKYLYQ